MFDSVIFLIGQALGVIAVILGFTSYQMKTPKSILFFQIATASVFAVHYLLINAMSAVALNALSAVACVFYYFREKRDDKTIVVPVVFTVLIAITGVATWEGWRSAPLVAALVVNSMGLTLSNAQKMRMCVLVKAPLALAYNIIVLSGGGIIYECATLISAVIGIVKNKAPKTSNQA